jgi:hypothetical protein
MMWMIWMTFQSRWTLIKVMISSQTKRLLRELNSSEKGMSKL